MLENISTENFNEKVSEGLALIDFWAEWCGPCRMQTPIIEELSEEEDSVNFYAVDVDENQDLAAHFGIMSIPTLMVAKDGKIVEKLIGVHAKEQLSEILEKHK